MMDAICTIRLNSKRVPRKSVRELNGIPLLNYTLKTMNQIPEIDRIIVYASTPEVCDYILPGIHYEYIERPKYLDGDEITFHDTMSHGIQLIESDYVVFFCVTQPFIQSDSVHEMCVAINNLHYDSSYMVREINGFCWMNRRPLNYHPNQIPKTQDIEPVLVETGGLYIFSKKIFAEHSRRIGTLPYLKRVDQVEGLDIDTEENFQLAEIIAQHRNTFGEEDGDIDG